MPHGPGTRLAPPEMAALVTEYELIIDGADFLSGILSGFLAK